MSAEFTLLLLIGLLQRPRTPPIASWPHRPDQRPNVEVGPYCDDPRRPVRKPIREPSLTEFLVRDPFLPPLFFSEEITTMEFFGPPVGFYSAPLLGFDEYFVYPVIQQPVFVSPAPAFDPRIPPQRVQPAAPRGGTTDIPVRLVEELIEGQRPSLAVRAAAARLEGAADRLFRAGHFARAAERYQQVLAKTPDNDDAKFKRGEVLIAAGNYDEASRTLRDALRSRPDWPHVPRDLRTLFPDEAAIRQVIDELDRESRQPDAKADLVFLRAYVLYFSGQREAAEAIFRNPPVGAATNHFDVFREAIERRRGGN